MLNAFYGAFSPACFALLGLWLVVVQIRLPEWQRSPAHLRMSYGVALYFALPGIMSVLALVNPQNPLFWQVSFAIIAWGGVIVLVAVRGVPGRRAPAPARTGGAAGGAGTGAAAGTGAMGQLGVAAYVLAVVLYVLIGLLAFHGGMAALRTEAILLTAMLVLGFNAAWLLMFEGQPFPAESRPADH